MIVPVFAAKAKNSFTELDAYDYEGNHVTSELFKDHDVTMVNVFTTWCIYCILEMKDLNQMYVDLPENANLVMICADAYEAPSDLDDLVKAFNIKNTIIKMKGSEMQSYYALQGYPTSFFVDSKGNILQVVVGAKSYESYMDMMKKLLEKYK